LHLRPITAFDRMAGFRARSAKSGAGQATDAIGSTKNRALSYFPGTVNRSSSQRRYCLRVVAWTPALRGGCGGRPQSAFHRDRRTYPLRRALRAIRQILRYRRASSHDRQKQQQHCTMRSRDRRPGSKGRRHMPAATRHLLYLFRDRTTRAKGGPEPGPPSQLRWGLVRYFASFGSVFT
jgi:hypothetical protein